MSIIQYILPVSSDVLNSTLVEPESVIDLIDEKHDEDEVWCLCKTSQAITYILTNQWQEDASELTFLLTGAPDGDSGYIGKYEETEEGIICEIEVGYGAAWFCRNKFIPKVYQKLSDISEKEIRKRFDGNKMDEEGIYPGVWSRGEEELQYLIDYFNIYKNCLREAVESKQDLILWQA